MAKSKKITARIQLRRDTAANWEAKDEVLLDGEKVIVITPSGQTRFKVGDGVKPFSQLQYTDEVLNETISNVKNTADNAKALADTAQTTAENAKSKADGCLPLTGGTMTGPITPTQYTALSALKNRSLIILAKEGSSNSAVIQFTENLESNTVPSENSTIARGIDNPVLWNDVANKFYADHYILGQKAQIFNQHDMVIDPEAKVFIGLPITPVEEGTCSKPRVKIEGDVILTNATLKNLFIDWKYGTLRFVNCNILDCYIETKYDSYVEVESSNFYNTQFYDKYGMAGICFQGSPTGQSILSNFTHNYQITTNVATGYTYKLIATNSCVGNVCEGAKISINACNYGNYPDSLNNKLFG